MSSDRFDLPSGIPGVILVNRLTFEDFLERSGFNCDVLAEGLAQCGVVDRLFFRVGLQIDRSQETIGLAQHRGELQVIHRRTAEFSQSLPIRRSHSLGVAIIGNITEYCRSLLDANLLSLIDTGFFVVFNRDDKARLARQLIDLFDCLRRSEPFDQNLSSCWSEGSAVVQELWLAHASRSGTGVHRLC